MNDFIGLVISPGINTRARVKRDESKISWIFDCKDEYEDRINRCVLEIKHNGEGVLNEFIVRRDRLEFKNQQQYQCFTSEDDIKEYIQ